MGTRTGRASVDIVADVSEFGSRFEKDLNNALKDTKVNAKPVSDKLARDIDDGVKAAEKSLQRLDRTTVGTGIERGSQKARQSLMSVAAAATEVAAVIDDAAEGIGENLGEGITRGADGKLRDARGRFLRAGEQLGEQVGDGITRGMDGKLRDGRGRFVGAGERAGDDVKRGLLRRIVSAAGSAASSLVTNLGKGMSGLTSMIGSNPYVAAAGIALGVALAAAAAPALGAALSSATILGSGLGLIGLGAWLLREEPKLKKAAEKLTKTMGDTFTKAAKPMLKPLVSALKIFRNLVTEIGPAVKWMFEEIGGSGAIEALAKGLGGMIKAMIPGFEELVYVAGPFLKMFAEQLPIIGAALGTFFETIAGSSPEATLFFQDFIKLIAGIIVTLGQFIAWLTTSYPAVRKFLLDSVAWLQQTTASVREWFNSTEEARGRIGAAFAAIGAAAVWLWLYILVPAFNGIVTAVKAVAAAAVWLWQTILVPAFNGIAAAAVFVWQVLVTAWNGITAAVTAVGAVVTWLWTTIIQPYFTMIATIAMWLWNNIIVPAFNGIVAAVRMVGATIAWLYSVMAPPIQAVAGLIFWLWKGVFMVAFAAITAQMRVVAAAAMWLWNNILSPVFRAIGAGAMAMYRAFIVPAFNGIRSVLRLAGNAARQLWTTYISPAWRSIQAATRTMWSVISSIFNAIRSHIVSRIRSAVAIVSAIRSFVSQVSSNFTSLVNNIRSRLNNAVSIVRSLPGRIRSAVGNLAGLLVAAGRNVINGLINGIQSRLGALRAKAAAAASVIRNLFPFSPAKEGPLSGSGSPEIAGGKIATMIASGMQRRVGSIQDAAKAMADATMGRTSGSGLDFAGQGIMRSALGSGGSGAVTPAGASGGSTVTFADGAIRITFAGAVPTTDEAFRTGQAVGAGIASTLTSRNIMNTVRTI